MTAHNWENAFDCLRAPDRRAVLFALHERVGHPVLLGDGSGENGEAPAMSLDDVDADLDAVRMHHVHLPKLADAGYIERTDDDRVAPGDSFDEIQPLLETLVENKDALPGIAELN